MPVINPTQQSERLSCTGCNRDFAVILEPDYCGMPADNLARAGFKPAEITHCPFCGEEVEDSDDEPEDLEIPISPAVRRRIKNARKS